MSLQLSRLWKKIQDEMVYEKKICKKQKHNFGFQSEI